MARDKLQLQRLELKYLVKEDVALEMRDFVSVHLGLDENCVGKPDFSYMNHSIYLDSPRLGCYWDVINGIKNRYKLRLRFYSDNPTAPVFFEIKRRMNNAILKQRGAVYRDAVAGLLGGQLPETHHLVTFNPKYLTALQRFHELMVDNQASPKTHVAYLREAWVSESDNSVRVTFDRNVRTAPHTDFFFSTEMGPSVQPWGDLVILELKFTGRFPEWFGELARIYEVIQCGVAKYAEGVALLDERRQFSAPMGQIVNGEQTERFRDGRTTQRKALLGSTWITGPPVASR